MRSRLRLPVLSIAFLAVAVAQETTTQEPSKTQTVSLPNGEEYELHKPFIVCTTNIAPMSSCSTATNSTESFKGLSIQVFRETARDALDWNEGDEYKFACVETSTTDTLLERVVPADGDCDAFIASTTITHERQRSGVVWATSYYDGSIGVVVKAEYKTSNGWGWVLASTDVRSLFARPD